MSRPAVLQIAGDPYVLRACELHDVEPIVLAQSGAVDSGQMRVPAQCTIIRTDDVTNVEDCLAALYREGLADRQFAAVQTTWEQSMVTAAALGSILGCRSMDATTALYFRDKSLQKARLRSAGVPVTRWTVVPDIYNVDDVPFEFGRAVLKPIAGGGTTSTSLVLERSDLEQASRAARECGETSRTYLLEEFVEGDELLVEGVVFGGEVLFFGLGIYAEPCLDAIMGQVPISFRRMDPVDEAEVYESAEPVVRGAISALGLQEGVFHMELFHNRDTGGMVFSECAARRGGAMIQEQVLAKFNVDLGEAALLCALGRKPELDVDVLPKVVGCLGLYGPEGTIVSYPTPDELMDQPNVEWVEVYAPLGGTLNSKFSGSADMLAVVLLLTETVAEFEERVVQLRQWFTDRLAVAEPGLTGGQRWAWARKHWPERNYRNRIYTRK